jgi:hypothetical protein
MKKYLVIVCIAIILAFIDINTGSTAAIAKGSDTVEQIVLLLNLLK